VSYSKDEKYLSALKSSCGAYKARIEKMDDAELERNKNGVNDVWRALDVLIRNKVLEKDAPFCKFIRGVREKKGWK